MKEETLKNKIHCIDIELWQETMESAYLYSQSNKGRSIKANDIGNDNAYYETPAGLPLSASHLMSLLMYTNLTTLQYKYKKYACRKINDDDPEEELIQRHREISNWYKLLYESTHFFGDKASKKVVYYTGMNIPLQFKSFRPTFCCPISTTTQWSVAHGFSKGKGIILKLQAMDNSWDHCFDVEWFSNFPHEKEKLFGKLDKMEIKDIQYFRGRNLYKSHQFIKAFRLWSSLFDGYYIFKISNIKEIKRTQLLLSRLISNFKQNNGIELYEKDKAKINIPIYIQQLFYGLLSSFKNARLYIIQSQYSLLKEELKRELYTFDDLSIKLSPFLSHISAPTKVKFFEEYHWILTDEELTKFKMSRSHQYVFSPVFKYTSKEGVEVTFKIFIYRKADGSKYTSFGMKIEKRSAKILHSEWASIADEISHAHRSRKKIKQGMVDVTSYFFADHLVDDLSSLALHLAVCFYA